MLIIRKLYGAGHVSRDHTIDIIERHIFWPTLHWDTSHFMEHCHLCQVSKGTASNAYLYCPLSVSSEPWASISMDFMVGLPHTQWGSDAIFVAVD